MALHTVLLKTYQITMPWGYEIAALVLGARHHIRNTFKHMHSTDLHALKTRFNEAIDELIVKKEATEATATARRKAIADATELLKREGISVQDLIDFTAIKPKKKYKKRKQKQEEAA